MKIFFLLSRTNSLPFFIPLADFLKNFFDISFIFSPLKDSKYNSVFHENNKKEVLSLIKDYKIYFPADEKEFFNLDIDILFSVEGNGFPAHKKEDFKFKHIIIQNYHDWTFSCQYPKTEYLYQNCYALWLLNESFLDLSKILNISSNIFCGILPYYWHYENKTKEEIVPFYNIDLSKKNALCFLPRARETIMSSWKDVKLTPSPEFHSGDPKKDIEHVLNFSEFLKENDFNIIYKQRQKNRNLDFYNNNSYIEDVRCFPGTSLDLLFVSDLSYGYMTSAIMDASIFGGRYINFWKDSFPPLTKKIFDEYKKFDNIDFCDLDEPFNKNFLKKDIKNNFILNKIEKTKNNLLSFLAEIKCES